jgi:enoyl-CoA hydratase
MADDILLIDTQDRVRTLTLNRPQSRNALSAELRMRFFQALRDAQDDDDVDVVILTGADPVFCAGLDLKELGDTSQLPDISPQWPPMTKPVIGGINGAAVTGGLELALYCDILIASEQARFADTHARVGITPGWGLSQKLSRAIGPYRAKELSLTGNFLDASTAYAWGLVNRVVAPEELMPTALKLAREMADIEADMLITYKAMIDDGYALSMGEGLELEHARSTAYNAQVTPEMVAQRRAAVQARGRTQ